MDPLRPEAGAGPGADARARLRPALAAALRARDMVAVSALRSALAAIGNAEAVEPGVAAPPGSGSPHVAGSVAGLGAAEAERRRLSAAEIGQIVRAEAGERERAARDYKRAGHADRAGRLRREAQVLLAVLAPRSWPAGQPDSLGTDPGQRARPHSGRHGQEAHMPDETRHESADLTDYEVKDASDTLEGDPGNDPLDRGVAPPERWSAGVRFGTTAEEQEEGESLDQQLAEEEPDIAFEADDERPEDIAGDEDAGDEDVDGLLLDDGPDPRAGRLVADDEGAHPDAEADLVAHDAGIDGGAASAEEAAVHVVEDDDTDIRSGD